MPLREPKSLNIFPFLLIILIIITELAWLFCAILEVELSDVGARLKLLIFIYIFSVFVSRKIGLRVAPNGHLLAFWSGEKISFIKQASERAEAREVKKKNREEGEGDKKSVGSFSNTNGRSRYRLL